MDFALGFHTIEVSCLVLYTMIFPLSRECETLIDFLTILFSNKVLPIPP